MKSNLIRIVIWASTAGAFLAGLAAAQCVWMCRHDPYHQMGMDCWFSRLTGLPCDYGTFGLLILLMTAAVFVANAGALLDSHWRYKGRRG